MSFQKYIVAPGRSVLVDGKTYEEGQEVLLDPENNGEHEEMVAGVYVLPVDATQGPAKEAVISPLSEEMAPERDYTAERDSRVIPLARKLLALFAGRSELPMGFNAKKNDTKTAIFFEDLYKQVIAPELIASDLYLSDISYLFSIMLQPLQMASDLTTSTFKMNLEIGHAKAWNVLDIDDLKISDLETMLTKDSVDKEPKADESAA